MSEGVSTQTSTRYLPNATRWYSYDPSPKSQAEATVAACGQGAGHDCHRSYDKALRDHQHGRPTLAPSRVGPRLMPDLTSGANGGPLYPLTLPSLQRPPTRPAHEIIGPDGAAPTRTCGSRAGGRGQSTFAPAPTCVILRAVRRRLGARAPQADGPGGGPQLRTAPALVAPVLAARSRCWPSSTAPPPARRPPRLAADFVWPPGQPAHRVFARRGLVPDWAAPTSAAGSGSVGKRCYLLAEICRRRCLDLALHEGGRPRDAGHRKAVGRLAVAPTRTLAITNGW